MFTSGMEWVPSLRCRGCTEVHLTCTEVARDAAKDFRGAEEGGKCSSKCFSLSGIHVELFPLLCILQPLLSSP